MRRGQTKQQRPIDAATRAFCERETVRLLPFIARLARRSNLPLPIEDLIQEGAIAAFQALPKFDAARGAKVETWLTRRVLGAMQDYARALGGRPGSQRARYSKMRSLQSFKIEGDNGKEQRLEYAIEAPPPPPPRGDWAKLLQGLNQREQLMVLEYFVHGRTMRQIADDLGLSESRISQAMTSLVERLRQVEAENGRVREALCA